MEQQMHTYSINSIIHIRHLIRHLGHLHVRE